MICLVKGSASNIYKWSFFWIILFYRNWYLSFSQVSTSSTHTKKTYHEPTSQPQQPLVAIAYIRRLSFEADPLILKLRRRHSWIKKKASELETSHSWYYGSGVEHLSRTFVCISTKLFICRPPPCTSTIPSSSRSGLLFDDDITTPLSSKKETSSLRKELMSAIKKNRRIISLKLDYEPHGNK